MFTCARPSSPKAAAPPKRSRRSRRALLLDERSRLNCGPTVSIYNLRNPGMYRYTLGMIEIWINMNQYESIWINIRIFGWWWCQIITWCNLSMVWMHPEQLLGGFTCCCQNGKHFLGGAETTRSTQWHCESSSQIFLGGGDCPDLPIPNRPEILWNREWRTGGIEIF